MNELEDRKRALVRESEICREALQAEVQNLQLQAAGFFQKFNRVRSIAPWLMLAGPVAIPLVGALFGRRKKEVHPAPAKGAVATALLALNLYRKYGPLVRSLVGRFRAGKHTEARTEKP